MKNVKKMWHPRTTRNKNVYVAFMSRFSINGPEELTLRVFGCDTYRLYLDGKEIIDGPARFERNHPEYDEVTVCIPQGSHVLYAVVHCYGVPTRMTAGDLPPFLQICLAGPSGIIPLKWKCKALDAFKPLNRRLNVQLGWMEFCDMRELPDPAAMHDSVGWIDPVGVDIDFMHYAPNSTKPCRQLLTQAVEMCRGIYINEFGYEDDDPPVRFMLRNLHPGITPEGIWLRFDLQKIGLYRPRIVLKAPEGMVVEAGYSETLKSNRVMPFISLSLSPSCHMDRWVTKAGMQELITFSPRGFRFMEVHIAAHAHQVEILQVNGLQRTYFDQPAGSFYCSDVLLNEIWKMSVDTLQSCSEDALTDTPVRERGQWMGDAVAVGLETMAIAYGDMSLIKRGLRQAAQCKRGDGLIPALYPGQHIYLSSFSLLWIVGCMRYYRLTGDLSLLRDHAGTAAQTIAYFWKRFTPKGLDRLDDIHNFIDWGHIIEDGHIDVALNLIFLAALRELKAWEEIIGTEEAGSRRARQISEVERTISKNYITSNGLIAKSISADEGNHHEDLQEGYHSNVWGLLLGLFNRENQAKAVQYVKTHMLRCFPNNDKAPRLAHPAANDSRLITPYFSHFALRALWEAGEADFVLQQYRVCWGWMLKQGSTTLLEVFDPRWSHCHAWSGCPAWQLSRYAAGITPCAGGDPYSFVWEPQPGRLEYARVTIPIVNQLHRVRIEWRVDGGECTYRLDTDVPLKLTLTDRWQINHLEINGMSVEQWKHGPLEVHTCLKISFSVYRQGKIER
jgi:alpha-L-rhamnosidase